MVNNRAKMQRSNQKTRNWLDANGYKNIYFFPHSRFSKDYHITIGSITLDFDGLAHDNDGIVFFQVKSNCRCTKNTLAQYELVGMKLGVRCLWFNAVDREGLFLNNIKC